MNTPERSGWRWEQVVDPRVRAMLAVFGHDFERLNGFGFIDDYAASMPERGQGDVLEFVLEHTLSPDSLADALVISIGRNVTVRHREPSVDDLENDISGVEDPVLDPYDDVVYQMAALVGSDEAFGQADVAIGFLRGRKPSDAYPVLSCLSYLALDHCANG